MSRLLRIAVIICALSIPVSVAAAAVSYTFGTDRMNARWEGMGQITGTLGPSGITLATKESTGSLLSKASLTLVPDTVTMTLSATAPGIVRFAWFEVIDKTATLYRVRAPYPAGDHVTVSIPMTGETWIPGEKIIGITVSPHTTITVHDLAIVQSSWLGRIVEGIRSFWTFDVQHSYHINFLWGPHLAWTSGERALLWETVPPSTLSATKAISIVLLCALVILALIGWWRGTKEAMLSIGIALCIGAWVVMDARMGLELLSWIRTDHQWAWAADREDLTFRDRGRFYDFAAFAAPLVADRSTYIFTASREWPYLGNIRYLTYPSIPGRLIDTDDTWVVFERPDITLGDDHRLWSEGAPISRPGTMRGDFAPGSFVFRVSPSQ